MKNADTSYLNTMSMSEGAGPMSMSSERPVIQVTLSEVVESPDRDLIS